MPAQAANQQPTHNIQVRLALERTRAAYERTIMVGIRTATSLITFGFGVYKFLKQPGPIIIECPDKDRPLDASKK